MKIRYFHCSRCATHIARLMHFSMTQKRSLPLGKDLFFVQFYAFCATSTSFANAAGSLIAISLSILRLIVTFACFRPCMNVE